MYIICGLVLRRTHARMQTKTSEEERATAKEGKYKIGLRSYTALRLEDEPRRAASSRREPELVFSRPGLICIRE